MIDIERVKICSTRLKKKIILEDSRDLTFYNQFKSMESRIFVRGRILAKRNFGKICFASISYNNENIELAFFKDLLPAYKLIDALDLGDIIYVSGAYTDRTKNKQCLTVYNWTINAKCLNNLPDKYSGLIDQEIKFRQKYLQLIVYKSSYNFFKLKQKAIQFIRGYLNTNHQALECFMPTLERTYGGAMAKPFETILNESKKRYYLSVSPELKLKELIVAGFQNIYSFAKCFRNEGIDRTHHPEFQMLEAYFQDKNHLEMAKITEEIIKTICQVFHQAPSFIYNSKKINLQNWITRDYFELITDYTKGILPTLKNESAKTIHALLIKPYSAFELNLNKQPLDTDYLLDEIFSIHVQPNLIQPTHVINFPVISTPLCKRNPEEPNTLRQIESYICSQEVANIYDEEVDFVLLERAIFEHAEKTNNPAVYNSEFLTAMSYGCPVLGGLGIGLDRVFNLIGASNKSLKSTILFPLS